MQVQPWMDEYKKWNINPCFDLPDPTLTLVDIIDRQLVKYSQNTAFIYLNHKFTFEKIDQFSRNLAIFLQNLGIAKGSRIAVMLPNIVQYPIATFAIIRAGYILVNVNPLYTQRELNHQLNDSGAEVLIVLSATLDTLTQITDCPTLQHIISTQAIDFINTDENRETFKSAWLPIEIQQHDFKNIVEAEYTQTVQKAMIEQNDTAVLQYTGGTTGVSKGAELTHRNIIFNVLQNSTVFNSHFGDRSAEPDEAVLCALPLYHIYGFTICLFSYGLNRGFANILIPNPRNLEDLVLQYKNHRPAVFPGVNTLFNALVNHTEFQQLDHSHLKSTTGGGTAILKATADQWHSITGRYIFEGYGLSETSPTATFNPPLSQRFSETIGIPLPNTEIKLVNQAGQSVGLNAEGEIAIRGPQVMKGYWQQHEATEHAFTSDGFFLTGDIGCMNAQGYISLLDRKKDMILVSGFNVYPNEIEYVLSLHPKVLESAVIGIKDEKSGQVPKAFIVKKDQNLTVDEINQFLKQQLTSYKIPKYIEFMSDLPKSTVGKILRRELSKA